MTGLSVAQIDSELVSTLGTDDTDISSTDRLLYINRSFWEVATKFNFREKDGSFNFNTVTNVNNYAVPGSFDSMEFIAIEDIVSADKFHTQLVRMTQEVYQSSYDNSINTNGKPVSYYREGSNVILFPTPDNVYPITMKYLIELQDLLSNGTVIIPRAWHEIILFGAVYRGFLRLNDTKRADYYREQQIQMIDSTPAVESKEEGDSRFAGLDVIRTGNPNQNSSFRPSLWKGQR